MLKKYQRKQQHQWELTVTLLEQVYQPFVSNPTVSTDQYNLR